jgi:ATP synthase protein I
VSWLFFAGSYLQARRRWRDQEALVLTDDRRTVPLTLLAQAGVSVGLAIMLWWAHGSVAAVSALLGGMVAVIPNGFLAARLLTPRTSDARGLLRSAWIGELGKVVLTALLFAVIFGAIRPIAPLAVFGGFIAAQFVVLGALVFPRGTRKHEA